MPAQYLHSGKQLPFQPGFRMMLKQSSKGDIQTGSVTQDKKIFSTSVIELFFNKPGRA